MKKLMFYSLLIIFCSLMLACKKEKSEPPPPEKTFAEIFNALPNLPWLYITIFHPDSANPTNFTVNNFNILYKDTILFYYPGGPALNTHADVPMKGLSDILWVKLHTDPGILHKTELTQLIHLVDWAKWGVEDMKVDNNLVYLKCAESYYLPSPKTFFARFNILTKKLTREY